MTEKIKVDQLKEATKILQDIKNGIGTNDNKLRMEAFYTLNSLNQIIERLEMMTDHQPTFEVGEYYSDGKNQIYRVDNMIDIECYVTVYHKGTQQILEATWLTVDCFGDKPATAEQIAEFKRAEHFAKHGRKLDEFRVGDKVQLDGRNEVIAIESIGNDFINGQSEFGNSVGLSKLLISETHLIQTAEELREVDIK